MSKESKLSEEFGSNSMNNPIRQNNDYTGNFLDKIKDRNKRREERKKSVYKIANQEEFKLGDQVKVIRNEPYDPIEAVVLSVFQRDDEGNPAFYTLRFQYEGEWRKHTAEAARIVANPEGKIPLSDNSSDEEENLPNSIKEEISDKNKDNSLKPVYSDNYGFYVFPNYEFGVYSQENDEIVDKLNKGHVFYLTELLSKLKDKNLASVVKDAAAYALYKKNPDNLIKSDLYDFTKENYPKYWGGAIRKVIIKDKNLNVLPSGKYEEVYDLYKEAILPVIFSKNPRDFNLLFIRLRERGTTPNYEFLFDRLFQGNAPEFKEALKNNIDKLSNNFIYRMHIYAILPEETKDKMLQYLEYQKNDSNNIKRSLNLSGYIPEALKYMEESLKIHFDKIFDTLASEFLERFTPEKRNEFYSKYLPNNKPSSIFHKIKFTKDKENAKKIIGEVPKEIWDELGVKLIKDNVSYFFIIDASYFIPFSENVIKYAYTSAIEYIVKNKYHVSEFAKSKSFNTLVEKYSLPMEKFLKIYNYFSDTDIKNSSALSKLLNNYGSSIVAKINKGSELNKDDLIFIERYMLKSLYRIDNNDYDELNTILGSEYIEEIRKRLTRKDFGFASDLFDYIYDSKEPFLSEKAFVNLINIAEDGHILDGAKNFGKNKPFISWMPMSKLANPPSDELLRFYSEKLVSENPLLLFQTNGLENINLTGFFAEEELSDIDVFKSSFNISDEVINEIAKTNPEGLKEAADKIRADSRKAKESGKIPLIKRFPDLLIPALQHLKLTPYILDTKLDYCLKLFYKTPNDIPIEIINIIFNKILKEDETIKSLFKNDLRFINLLKDNFTERFLEAIKSTARRLPVVFLNSEYGKNRANYNKEIFEAIGDLTRRNIQSWSPSENKLSDETKDFFLKPGNEDLIKAIINRAIDIQESETLIDFWPEIAEVASKNNIKMMPIASLRAIEDIDTAKSVYKTTRNDIEIEGIPEEIKINKSIYQTEQRPEDLKEYTRYTISNNNTDPTPVLYNIGKKLIHAGDGVAHNNVGASGFTNSWALASFPKINNKESIIIEQYQSDYPPVLFNIFNKKNTKQDPYENDNNVLQSLIRDYGDKEAIDKYISEVVKQQEIYPDEIMRQNVNNLNWSIRTTQNLGKAGIGTIGELVNKTEKDLLKSKFFGRKSVNEIKEVLSENNLSLLNSNLKVGDKVIVIKDGEHNHLDEIGTINRLRDIDEYIYSVVFPDGDIEFFKEDEVRKERISVSEIELPIELAPDVKDVRTHFEYISKAYPYLAIINTIKVAQAKNIEYIYIFRDAATYAEIGNKEKAYKLYQEIPSVIGEEYYDEEHDLRLWKIATINENIQILKAMIKEQTGKDDDYQFNLTPAQNQELKERKIQEQKKKKQEWNATPEKQQKLNEIENAIRNILPSDTPNFYSPQQALRFLGQDVKGKLIPKKKFNSQFGKIMRDLGMLARASRRKNRMIKLSMLFRKEAIEWNEGVPNFNWIEKGILKKIKLKNPLAFDKFIDLNSDKFVEWDPIKYIGSGAVGDAWELADGRVLKIYDEGATVGLRTDSEKYEDIMEAQHDGTADPNLPMIYEYGSLEAPTSFYGMKSPSLQNPYGYYRPAYVIMEKVETPRDMAKQHIKYNPYLLEPTFTYDEETEDYIEREYEEGKEIPPISEDEVPPSLFHRYHEALHDGTYDDFIKVFSDTLFHYITSDMLMVFENRKEEYEEAANTSLFKYDSFEPFSFEKDNEEGEENELPEDVLDLKDPEDIKILIDEMAESVDNSQYYIDDNLAALERILNLPKGWEKQLASAIANNLFRNRTDIHGGNFGFRNNKVVFFDA